jgi:hypothetical protein
LSRNLHDSYESGKWTSISPAVGDCGRVVISTLERDRSSVPNLSFWIYKYKAVIRNKEGKLMGLGDCRKLDEREYTFDWRSPTNMYMGCDYIEFSPL